MLEEWAKNCVSYLRVGVDGWHDGVVVVDPRPIMRHGRRRSISQRSRQNILTHFLVEARTHEYFIEGDRRAWLARTI
jgi:hypothetical protein